MARMKINFFWRITFLWGKNDRVGEVGSRINGTAVFVTGKGWVIFRIYLISAIESNYKSKIPNDLQQKKQDSNKSSEEKYRQNFVIDTSRSNT